MYTPLYIKTENSLLSSYIRIPSLVKEAARLGYKALTITDMHMFGVMEFYYACLENNIKPVIGMEVKFEDYIFVLYAKNKEGYKNLCHIETIISSTSITLDELKKYSSSLICILPFSSRNLFLKFDFYSDIYFGYQNDDEYNKLDGKNSLYMSEVLSLNKEDTVYLKYLEAIKKGILVSDVDYFYEEFYLKTIEDYKKIDHDFDLNIKVFSDINIVIEKEDNLLAEYDTNGIKPYDYLKKLCKEGLKRRFGEVVPRVYMERLKYELEVIEKMGFSNYFLVVQDYVLYAKKNGILVGPGRGSAAGSFVSYVLGITDIDPIRYNLLFERFLNPERVTMPDIDVDFLDSRREEVINYCKEKYGLKRTSGIITFGTLASKQAIRDVFRTLNLDSDIVSKELSSHLSLEDNFKNNVKLQNYLKNNLDAFNAYKIASKLEGLKRHTSIHAAGVVISKIDLDNVVPLYMHNGMYVTGYSMNYLENLGLLKMDFLGLKNLNIIDQILRDLKNDGISVDLNKIPLNDKKTLKIFYDVDTKGIFQFESDGMMSFLRKLKPNCFEDIYAALALYRPGPMGSIDSYIARKENREHVNYYDARLEKILKPTYGILIYQEQIMQVANVMASYSYGEADILRRAMSKKKEDIILKEKDKFISRSIKNGYSLEVAREVYAFILKFASYGFNKAHSVAYAMISYQMAYLKAYYPAYFIRSLLNMSIGSSSMTREYLTLARNHKIKILPPDVNLSDKTYKVVDNSILYPLYNIKNVGSVSTNVIINERASKPFSDIYDFVSRTFKLGVDRGVLTSLIFSGALDSFGLTRKTLINSLDAIVNYGEMLTYLDKEYALAPLIVNEDEYPKTTLMEQEREVFGFYLTHNPVSDLKAKNNILVSLNDLKKYFDKNIKFIACVKKKREITTKKNEVMCFLTFEDEESEIEGVIFPNVYKNLVLEKDAIYLINAHIERRYDSYQAVVTQIKRLDG